MIKKNMKRKDNDYPVSSLRSYLIKNLYTNLGHNEDTYFNPVAMQHILTGIQYACGDVIADATPSAKPGLLPNQLNNLGSIIKASLLKVCWPTLIYP